MKRIVIALLCLSAFASLHSQGITLLYKNNLGWYNPLSWIQINTPSGQAPIQRVPTADDDVVFSHSMSGITSAYFSTEYDSLPDTDFNIGGDGPGSPSRCRSMHISNTEISFYNSSLTDAAPTVNVYTPTGGFVIIDSGSYMHEGHFALHGGNPAVTDLQILHSVYGVLFSHADWTGIVWDSGAGLKIVGSELGGWYFGGKAGANIFIDSSHISTNDFIIGDSSKATLTNTIVTNDLNNDWLNFFIGKKSNFVSANDTVFTWSHLKFTTSGSQFNGNVGGEGAGPGLFEFLQEDTAHPLPNIINGSLSTAELTGGLRISGDLKISGNLSGFADDVINNPIPIFVNSQDVFHVGGVENFGSSAFINNCTNDFCHFRLEFFGSTNSNIAWNGGFPIDTLVINKTGCAKVTCDSSLYVAGATKIESGQLVLNPNDNYPYKFVCAGNVDIAQGGGLFLRKDAAGVVANIAVEGTLTDHNTSADSTCAGLSNPYNGVIKRAHSQGITLLYKNDLGWNNPLSWMQINVPSGQAPIQRVPTADDDVVISHSMSGIAYVGISTDDDTLPDTDFNVGGDGPGSASRCRSIHISNTQISFDNSSLFYVEDAPTVNVYTSNGGFVIIDSGSNVLHGHFALHGGNPVITDLQILNSVYGVLFSHGNWTGMDWDSGAGLKFGGSALAGFHFVGHGGATIFIDSSRIETNNFIIGDSSTATLTNSMITNNGNNVYLTFFIGKNSNFVSARDTVFTYSDLSFTTSGSQFNGDVKGDGQGPGMFEFLQEDTAHPLPNIINGSLSTNELATGISLSGDLKISGDLSGFADDAINNPIAVFVDSQDVFHAGGIENFGSSPFINNCTNGFCHFRLEFFGSTNSNIGWNGGFPVDTLIINKTGCAKVTCDSSLYVAGETRIKGGQLSLLPNEYPYKFVCAGNVDISQGGGLFLRRDASGVVANMAIKGTLVDHNASSDTACAGLSNPYNGTITFYTDSTTTGNTDTTSTGHTDTTGTGNTDTVQVVHTDSLINFSGLYYNKSIILNWTIENQVNTKYFVIEKSFDQLSFTSLANVAAAGNSQGNTDYRYTDSTSLKETNYYRLKMVEGDSSYSYSNTISIAAPVIKKVMVFPNPVKDKLYIRMPAVAAETEIIIADAKGSVINHIKLNAGTTEAYINTANLQPGVYYISFHSGDLKSTKQFVKQ